MNEKELKEYNYYLEKIAEAKVSGDEMLVRTWEYKARELKNKVKC